MPLYIKQSGDLESGQVLSMPYQPSAISFDTQLTGMTWTAFAILAMFWLKFDKRRAFLNKSKNIQCKLENVTQLFGRR